jgi:hypothetical protein
MNTHQTQPKKETLVDFKDIDNKDAKNESYTSVWNFKYISSSYSKKHPSDQKR